MDARHERTTAITEQSDQALGRAQRRLLRRIFNGRTAPILVDGRPFVSYKEASRYLLALEPDAREKAYTDMKNGAASDVPSAAMDSQA